MAQLPSNVSETYPSLVKARLQFPATLRSMKNRLQARYPEIRSSHLTEAIASGLGFRTHAALLVNAQEPDCPAVHRRFDAANFKARLAELGYLLREDLSLSEPSTAPPPPPTMSNGKGKSSACRCLEAQTDTTDADFVNFRACAHWSSVAHST